MKAPRVTLDQWRTLQAVVDHGGFAQAAEALHRSQSSVSLHRGAHAGPARRATAAHRRPQSGVDRAGGVLLRRSRQLVKQASQLEDPPTTWSKAGKPRCGWWSTRPTRAPAWSAPDRVHAAKPWLPGALREEVLSGVEEVLLEGVADLAITGSAFPAYWGGIERRRIRRRRPPEHRCIA
jgi:DNA-binding transcriptional LysR family regulator